MAKIYDVFIPDLGADKDVDLIDVMIKVGDIVDVEDGLITLETEKASMDVPTPYKGKIVEILVKVGDKVIYSETAEIHPGNRLSIANIPVGSLIHDVEIVPGHGGKLARSAGNSVLLQNIEAGYAFLKLPSGEIRKVRETCTATIGQVSNNDWMNVRIGKAGRKRHMGWRPQVRGKVMNPVDHPHGGGEGHNPIGMKYPKTPWGKSARGTRTRNKKRWSKKLIVSKAK